MHSHLSAVWSCLASRASLLKVFYVASVSGVIPRVSKKAVALEREGRKHRSEAGSLGAERNPGAAGAAGGGKKGSSHDYRVPLSSHCRSPLCPHHLTTTLVVSSLSLGVVAVIDGCSKLNQALVQGVGHSRHTLGHHHLCLPSTSLQTYNITLHSIQRVASSSSVVNRLRGVCARTDCGCSCDCVCPHDCACTCEQARRHALVSFLSCFHPFFLEPGSQVGPGIYQVSWAEPEGSACLCLSSSGI